MMQILFVEDVAWLQGMRPGHAFFRVKDCVQGKATQPQSVSVAVPRP